MKKISVVIVAAMLLVVLVVPADARRYGHHRGHGGPEALAATMFLIVPAIIAGSVIESNMRSRAYYDRPTCGSTYDCEYEREMLRLERQGQRDYERMIRERARQDARRDYRY